MENKQNTCKVSNSMKTSVQPVWKLSNVSAIYRMKNRLFSLTNLFISLKAWEKKFFRYFQFFLLEFFCCYFEFSEGFRKIHERLYEKMHLNLYWMIWGWGHALFTVGKWMDIINMRKARDGKNSRQMIISLIHNNLR